MNRQFTCNLCCEVVLEHPENACVDSLDGLEVRCPGCTALGSMHVDVDGDEGLVNCWFTAYRSEAERIEAKDAAKEGP